MCTGPNQKILLYVQLTKTLSDWCGAVSDCAAQHASQCWLHLYIVLHTSLSCNRASTKPAAGRSCANKMWLSTSIKHDTAAAPPLTPQT